MCNLSQGVYERGIQRGQKDTHRNDAIRLYQKGRDINFIADMLDESVEQIKEWLGIVLT